ncbi:MAG TPA: hypothetical protein VFW00_07115 [Rhodocyclaceae bacterium]|nr:hypothetical protein [Rhodocyclaceae bacterium]
MLRLPTSYLLTEEQKAERAAKKRSRVFTEEQKAAKREYDIRRRAEYAGRKKDLEQAPERKLARAEWLRGYRTKPQIALSLLVANAKYRAKKRGVEFTITPLDLEMPQKCPVLGIEIEHGNDDQSLSARDCAPSLDRRDNKKGYIPGNVRIISWRANRLKNDATVAELEAVLRYMRSE